MAHVIDRAVINHEGLTREGLLERAFAFAFRGLVYAQIWEDPVVDMAALQITPESHVVTIASGGCNVLSYLTADPARITAVDLNTAHIALNRLKQVAAKNIPDYQSFGNVLWRSKIGKTMHKPHRDYIRPHLDDTSRRYWEGRDLIGRRRIGMFSHGAYKRGLLGGFIGAAHLVAKLYRIDPRVLLEAKDMDDQRRIFEAHMAPIFDKRFVRWLTEQPASLFGLGIPPAQYDALAGDEKMAAVLRKRLERLACDYDLKQNYFAWQAFGRGYGRHDRRAAAALSGRAQLRGGARPRRSRLDPSCQHDRMASRPARRERGPLCPARCAGLDERRAADGALA